MTNWCRRVSGSRFGAVLRLVQSFTPTLKGNFQTGVKLLVAKDKFRDDEWRRDLFLVGKRNAELHFGILPVAGPSNVLPSTT